MISIEAVTLSIVHVWTIILIYSYCCPMIANDCSVKMISLLNVKHFFCHIVVTTFVSSKMLLPNKFGSYHNILCSVVLSSQWNAMKQRHKWKSIAIGKTLMMYQTILFCLVTDTISLMSVMNNSRVKCHMNYACYQDGLPR